jgi:hypothetical protein
VSNVCRVVVLSGAASLALQTAQAAPTLSETLAWMDSTYNPHGGAGGAFGHGLREESTKGKTFRRQTESFTYNGCRVTLKFQDDPAMPLFSEMASDHTDSFDLRDVDPSSITTTKYYSQQGGLSCSLDLQGVTCDMETMEFETRNQLPLIETFTHTVFPRLKGRDHESKSNGKTFVSAFYLDDLRYGARFEFAFRHAIELCGGKRSAF